MVVFYEHDAKFRKFVSVPQKYDEKLTKVKIISTPDCSLYRDMPLWMQIANIGVSRSVGYHLQQQGKYVIPNVRWGDERTYRSKTNELPVAFLGIPKRNVLSIGTYGCTKSKDDKYHLQAGLENMLHYLNPSDVIVYGAYNSKLFRNYERLTNFHQIDDWTTFMHKQQEGGEHGHR